MSLSLNLFHRQLRDSTKKIRLLIEKEIQSEMNNYSGERIYTDSELFPLERQEGVPECQ